MLTIITVQLDHQCPEAFSTSKDNSPGSLFFFFKDFIYLFFERGEGKEKERERNIDVWLPLAHLQQETQPATQAWTLTEN